MVFVHFSENIIITIFWNAQICDFINEHFICGMDANGQQYFINTNMEIEARPKFQHKVSFFVVSKFNFFLQQNDNTLFASKKATTKVALTNRL